MRLLLLGVVGCVALLACSTNDGPPTDAGSDAFDAGIDATLGDSGDDASDAGDDSGNDAGTDAARDAGDDAAGDAGTDAMIGSDADGRSDADSATDTSFDGTSPEDTLTYLVFRDFRRCAAPLCGGFWVQAVNRVDTTCADGTVSSDGCYVGGINWSALALSDEERAFAEATAGSLIIDGTLELRLFSPGGVELGSIVVQRAWGAPWGPAMTRPSADDFYNAADNGLSCLIPPCFNRDLDLLNTATTDVVSDIDLTRTSASAEQVALGNNALTAGNLRVAGPITTDSTPGPGGDFGRTLVATQFYLPIVPE